MTKVIKQVGRGVALTLVSLAFNVSATETIRVFFNDANPVAKDISLPEHIKVIGYNLDGLNKINDEIGNELVSRAERNGEPLNQEVIKTHLMQLMNSNDYPAYYNKVKQGALTLGNAMRFQIKKVPAIVFNEKSVVYGVTSLKEAIAIYAKRRKQ